MTIVPDIDVGSRMKIRGQVNIAVTLPCHLVGMNCWWCMVLRSRETNEQASSVIGGAKNLLVDGVSSHRPTQLICAVTESRRQ